MDEQLAAIYGTGQVEYEEDDLEKTAAAELLVKLAEEEGLDLNQFSDEEIAGMINELQGGIEHTAEAEETDEGQEKFAEADFLGRVMAHSMVQELNNIEKEAAKIPGATSATGRFLRRQVGKVKRVGQLLTGSEAKRLEGMSPTRGATAMLAKERKAVEKARNIAKGVGKGVGIGAAAGVGGYAGAKAGKGKEKKGSAFDTVAEQRALEMLHEAGYEVPGQEKVSYDEAVEIRALEMLHEAGYPVEWNE
jgi:hypothetical protein